MSFRKKIKTSKQYQQEQEEFFQQNQENISNAQKILQQKKHQRPKKPIKTNNFLTEAQQNQQQQQSNNDLDFYPQQDHTNTNLNSNKMLNSGQKLDFTSSLQKQKSFEKGGKQMQQQESEEQQSFNNSVTLKRNQLQQLGNFDKTVGNAGEIANKLKQMKQQLFEQQNKHGPLPDVSQEINTQNQIEVPISEISHISREQRAFSQRSGERYSLTTQQHQIYQQLGNSQQINQSLNRQQQQLISAKERKIQEAKERRQARTKLDKVIKIQSLARMYLARQLLKRLRRKFQRLRQENKATNELKKFEEQCVENYFRDRDRVVISERFAQTFTQPQGPGSLASLGDLKRNVFYPTLFQALAEQGNLDILTLQNEKESEAAFNGTQKIKQTQRNNQNNLQRPKTADNKTFYNYQTYKRPQDLKPTLENGFSQSYIKELQKDKKNSIINTFVRRNHPDAIKHAQKYAKTGSEEVQLRKLNKGEKEMNLKIQNLKDRLDQEHRQENNIQESSLSYASDFEKESIDNSKGKKNKKKLSTSRSRGSLQESISEENYYEESFEQESIQSDIRQDYGQRDSQKLSESIKIDEQISMEEDIIQEESGIREDINRSKSSGGGIEEDILEESDDYAEEGFESISEDVNSISYNKSKISEDIKSSLNFSKKKVSFGDSQGYKTKTTNPLKLDNKISSIHENQDGNNKYQNLEIKQFPSINNNDQQNQNQNNNDMQFQQYMQFQQFQQFLQQGGQQVPQSQQFVNLQPQMQFKKKEIPKDLDPEVKKVYEKYNSLKIFDQEMKEPIIKEQMEIKKLEAEIGQILNNTKKIQEKWHQEMEKDLNSNITIKADGLYTKFQCEFNQLLTTHRFGDKLKILSNFAFHKEMNDLKKESEDWDQKINSQNQPENAKNLQNSQKSPDNKFNVLENKVLKETLQNLENRQEVIIQVLDKVLANIGNIRESGSDISLLSRNNRTLEENIRKIAEGQQKTMEREFEKKQDQKFGEIKDMLKMVLNNQNKEQRQQKNKSKLQQLLDMNKDEQQQRRSKTSQQEYDEYLEMKYAQKKSDQEYIFDADYWRDVPYKHKPKDIPMGKPVRNNYFQDDFDHQQKQQMSPREKKIIQEQNTDEIVNFLTDQLMAEINRDLFPMRANSSQVFDKLEKDNSREIESKCMDKFVSPKNRKRLSGQYDDNNSSSHSLSYQQNLQSQSQSQSQNQNQNLLSSSKKKQPLTGVDSQSDESEFYPEESVEQDKLNNLSDKKGQFASMQQNFFNHKKQDSLQNKNNNINNSLNNNNNKNQSDINNRNKKLTDEKLESFNAVLKNQFNENFANSQEQDQDDSLIEEKAQSVENLQRIKETRAVLKNYSEVLRKKNKKKIIQNILEVIKSNQNRTLPEFTGAALQKVKIFDSREIENKEKDQLILDCFQEKIIENVVISINETQQMNKIKDQGKIAEILENKFNFFVEAAALKVQKMVKKLVPIDFYGDFNPKFKKFNEIYSYCQKNKGPEKNLNKGLNSYKYDETQDEDYGEQYLKYEENQDAEKFKSQVTDQLIDGVFDDIASGYVKIFEKRKKHLK